MVLKKIDSIRNDELELEKYSRRYGSFAGEQDGSYTSMTGSDDG